MCLNKLLQDRYEYVIAHANHVSFWAHPGSLEKLL